MKIYYSVANFISEKWIYDAVLSIQSVHIHNPDAQFNIYYDKEETKETLLQYLDGVNLNFVPDDWSDTFSKRLTQPYSYTGTGIYNLFRAMQEDNDFLFFDTDVFCFAPIEFSNTTELACKAAKGDNGQTFYTRCLCYVGNLINASEKLENLPIIETGAIFQDEIILNDCFSDILSPLEIKGVAHLGNTVHFQKKPNFDKSLFEEIYNKLKSNEDVSSVLYANYMRGID